MEELKYQIGTNKNPIFVHLKTFEGRKLVDIRKFFKSVSDENEFLPTKKGISINGSQLGELLRLFSTHQEDIVSFFNEIQLNEVAFSENFIEDKTGRSFEIEFSGGNTEIKLDDKIFNQKLKNIPLSKLIMAFYLSLVNVLDEEEDIKLILDDLDKKLKGLK